MLKNYILSLIILGIPTLLTAQKYDHQWPFGYGENLSLQFGISILDFNLGQVSVGSYAQKNVRIGNYGSFICDKEGKLILLTNNCAVFDRNFEVIDGSEVLTPGMLFDSHCEEYGYYPSYQSALFIPAIDNDSIIFLIHKDSEVSEALQDILSKHLYLSIIVKRPNGTFYLKEKKTLLATNLVTSRLTACLNADGTQWWVWAVGYNSNTFHKFLIGGPDTVQGPFTQQIGPALLNLEIDIGQTAYSHDARTFGINSKVHGAMLYDFNHETGEISNYRNFKYPLLDNGTAKGLAFSPSGQFLYLTAGRNLFQMDLQDPDPEASTVLVANVNLIDETNWPIGVGYLHSGPDCRLYVSPGSTTFYIHVVHQPDLKFPDCQFEVKAIKTPTNLAFNLPNLPMYRFGGACDGSIGWGIVGTGEAGMAQSPLHVFPNPAKEYATVRLPEGHGWSALVVYDVLGREVLRSAVAPGADSVEFNTGLLVSGLYLVMPLGERGGAVKLLVRH